MTEQAKTVTALATSKYEELMAATERKSMQSKLTAVYDASKAITEANGTPNFSNINAWISNNRAAHIISESTFFNKRPNPQTGEKERSPYCQIMDAWSDVASVKALQQKGSRGVGPAGVSPAHPEGIWISSDELKTIAKVDGPIAHKVSVMLGMLKGYQTQAKMRTAVKDNPKAPFLNHDQQLLLEDKQGLMLDEMDLQALENFIDKASANKRGIEFDDIGCVIARRVQKDSTLSDPGFIDALRKIIENSRG